jgi:hypothetical protein
MSDKVRYSIDFNDEWIQEDCHWKLDRIFTISCELLDSSIKNPKLEYTLLADGAAALYMGSSTNIYNNKIVCTAKLSDSRLEFDRYSDPENQNPDYNINTIDFIELLCRVNANGSYIGGDYNKSFSIVKAPPKMYQDTELTIGYVVDNPGEVKCSWKPYQDLFKNSGNLRGYNIELYHRQAGKTSEADFERVGFLKWDEESRSEGIYKLVVDSELEDSYTPIAGEEVYMNLNPGTELYIPDPNITEFYFTPKYFKIRKFNNEDTQINPGDEYEFRIYPYNIYSSYLEYTDGNNANAYPSSFITYDGTYSDPIKVPKGIVRVKVGEDWKEGQVWVMKGGQWKEAQAVYVKTSAGWKETK